MEISECFIGWLNFNLKAFSYCREEISKENHVEEDN